MTVRSIIAITSVLTLSACQKDVPRSQMPHLATFCMHEANWPKFLKVMRSVGQRHDMQLHGGIEKAADGKPQFNAYIARDYSYWFGDDLDLWITSNPFKAGEMSFGGISKRPWKQSDTEIAREVVTAAAPLWCESQKTTQIPR
jgi:hypothetical protein